MQWFVGWGDDIQAIGVCVNKSATRQVGAMQASLPNVGSESSVCRRLLVLYAGHAATKEQFGEELMDIDGDWESIQFAVGRHFGFSSRTATLVPENATSFREDYAEELNDRAKKITCTIVGTSPFMQAIRTVATNLLEQTPSDDVWNNLSGPVVVLSGPTVVKICEDTIGFNTRQIDKEWKEFIVDI